MHIYFKTYHFLIPVFFFYSAFVAMGQVKNEREYRVLEKDFPDTALDILGNRLKDIKRVRYFKEYDTGTFSYEVKFRRKGMFYSVEFNSIGQLQDIEVYINQDDIPESGLDKIRTQLKNQFSRYRIIKVQRQYPLVSFSNEDALFEQALEGKGVEHTNYEVVISGKEKEGFKTFEFLFDSQGNFLKKRKFASIGYDYILY
ncbi:hypothetical protein [uncultured Zobellia sp.]|uniref:hypothetical protein n=1 Tax=uncultured Zobellia sp. TaxID=255433 RepID=UPI002592BD48|nr:hypothetical protein [uncultured Zobellia sp.]